MGYAATSRAVTAVTISAVERRYEVQEDSSEREARWRAWMLAAQQGDASTYEKLLGELLPQLRGFVQRRVFDAGSREDVVQNVFLSIHRARHTYRPERPFTPWLFAVARNAITDYTRARGRRQAREVSLELDDVREPVAEPVEAEGEALAPELVAALSQLPAAQREAVVMIQLEGLSVAEAAERAGVSAGALKVRAHRGYRAMRATLGGSFENV
jgi:RNA polymerase sigma-70 factor (ECF subfamily)